MESVPEIPIDQLSAAQIDEARRFRRHFLSWQAFAERFPDLAPTAFARLQTIAQDVAYPLELSVANEIEDRAIAFRHINKLVTDWLDEYEIIPDNAPNHSTLRDIILGTVLVMASAEWSSAFLPDGYSGDAKIAYPTALSRCW